MQNMKRIIALVLLATMLHTPGTARSDAGTEMFSLMFRMMLTMMNIMGDMNTINTGSMGTGFTSPWTMGWPAAMGIPGSMGWPGGMGMPGGMTWPGGMGMPGGMTWPGGMGMPDGMNWFSPEYAYSGLPGQQYPDSMGFNPYGTNPGYLDGLWQGEGGDYLEIQGNRFTLSEGNVSISGKLLVRENRLFMQSPQTGIAQRYTYFMREDYLLLRNEQGQSMLYRRVIYPVAPNLQY